VGVGEPVYLLSGQSGLPVVDNGRADIAKRTIEAL
jgi:hypothetical protein